MPVSTLKFYTRTPPRGIDYPAIGLERDNWDDYGAKTYYLLYVHFSPQEKVSVGGVKILQKNRLSTQLPAVFESLDDSTFCSLGQSIDYYKKLVELNDRVSMHLILDAINDISLNAGLRENFEQEEHYKGSLFRFSEAEKALLEGAKIIRGIPVENAFNFGFSCKIRGADREHFVKFNFNKHDPLPGRTFALVGRNGTGKTQFLSHIASALSGLSEKGNFDTPHRPSFGKVLAISYSLFDDFEIPGQSKGFSYVYCGLRSQNGHIGEAKRIEKMEMAKQKVISKERIFILQEYFKKLVAISGLNEETDFLHTKTNDFYKKFSSGQSILFYILTEVVANIEQESLILFDEPEIHLHPEAISQLISILNDLLVTFDSYAIIATHSPIVIQEIPAKYIYVFEREGDTPRIRRLGSESFGENLTAITENIFQTINIDENYKQVLRTLSETMSYEEVNGLFESNLSFNAKVYLGTLYNDTER